MTRIAWIDASTGAAGDMLLAALHDAGAPAEVIERAVAALGVPVQVALEERQVDGWRVARASVRTPETDPPARTWRDVRALLDGADLDPRVAATATDAFRRLAEAEARVHGTDPEDVHFHEVGAADAIADVVGCAAAFAALEVDAVHVSPVALGAGSVRSAHGTLPVPVPAVLEILRAAGAPVVGGPVDGELCTPTGAALLAAVAGAWGPLPAMSVEAVGVGAGTRRLPDRPNIVRVVVGQARPPAPGTPTGAGEAALVLEANVDDLDPRLWSPVLARLLSAGAADAWLTPVLMKKGRPAHTLSVLVEPAQAEAVRAVMFAETTTLGLREHAVHKRALDRRSVTVDVGGCPVRVKQGLVGGAVVTAQPEYEDVAAAAGILGRPVASVLAASIAAAGAAGLLP